MQTRILVISSAADLCNAGISFGRGDNVGGGLSLAAAIPVVGAAANAARLGRTGKSIWTATKSKSAAQNALRHFNDHGKDFGAVNSLDYVRQTQNFLNSPPSGTLTKTRSNGDILRYAPGTNTFGVMDALGQPRTMFKPTDGMCYWNKQK